MATQAIPQLRVEVLGPVRVRRDDGPVVIPGRQGPLLLVLLVAEAGRVVDRERLIDGLWDGSPPPSARNALQGQVAGLRRVLGREAVETRGTGYRLAAQVLLDADEVAQEVDVAADLVAREAYAEAEAVLALAAERWRGPPFADLPDSDRLVAERARLEELRMRAQELHLEARVGAGHLDRAVAELERLVREHPTRERLRALQLRALLDCGRRGDALAAYDTARRWLSEELGVDPGEELQRAHRKVLLADAAETTAPPPPAVAGTPVAAAAGVLPRQTATFGREEDLARLLAVMAEEPLVTLVGPGGVGKTHLAVAAGHRVQAGTGQGPQVEEVHLIRLVDAATAADVPAVACAALGLTAQSDTVSTLVEGLSGRSALLIWDNLEHVIEGRTVLTRLLAELPEVGHLVTSRVPLRLHREARVPVRPLVGGDGASARLFAHRARRLDPSWQLPAGDAGDLERVLERCGGLPLAIELAAARLTTFSLAELADALERSSAVLATRMVDRPDRQQTMAANVGWSLDLLDDTMAGRVSALAVFRGCDIEAAAAVWQVDRAEARATIEVLVDNSLLVRSRGPDGRTRFTPYEPVRDALVERASRAELTEAAVRHATHYAHRFGHDGPFGFMCAPTDLVQIVNAERPNIRQAIRHLLAAEGGQLAAVRLLVGVFDAWFQQGPRSELREWVDAMRKIPDLPPGLRMDCDMILGLLLLPYDSAAGRDVLESVREDALSCGDAARAAWAARHEFLLTVISYQLSGLDPALRPVLVTSGQRARALAAACPDDEAVQSSEANRSLMEALMLDREIEHEPFAAALTRAERLGFPTMALAARNYYCQMLLVRGRFEEAYRVSHGGIGDDRLAVHHTYGSLLSQHGLAALALGHVAEGRATLGRALEQFLAAGDAWSPVEAVLRLAAGIDHAHALLAGEAFGISDYPVEVPVLRERLDALQRVLGDELDGAVRRGRDAVARHGLGGARRRWLAALRDAGALPPDGEPSTARRW